MYLPVTLVRGLSAPAPPSSAARLAYAAQTAAAAGPRYVRGQRIADLQTERAVRDLDTDPDRGRSPRARSTLVRDSWRMR